MENKRNRIRSLNDILRKQLDLLAAQSEVEKDSSDLALLSREMVTIYEALKSSESLLQEGCSSTNVETAIEDVVKRIIEKLSEVTDHSESQNGETNNAVAAATATAKVVNLESTGKEKQIDVKIAQYPPSQEDIDIALSAIEELHGISRQEREKANI